MRKLFGFVLTTALLLAIVGTGVVGAQEKVVLKLGEFVKGTISEKVMEVGYSFAVKKGDIVTLEILPDPAQPDLDPTIALKDSDGQVIAMNDDFNYPLALAVAEIPADGDYIAVAGRSGGAEGNSLGDYMLRVSVVKLVGPGSTIEAKINTDFDAPAQIYIMRPEASGTVELNLSQEVGEYYASMKLLLWDSEGYPDTLVNLDNTSKLSKAALSVDVEAGNFYVLKLEQASYSFSDPVDFPVTVEIK